MKKTLKKKQRVIDFDSSHVCFGIAVFVAFLTRNVPITTGTLLAILLFFFALYNSFYPNGKK